MLRFELGGNRRSSRLCEGVTRRNALQVGSLSLLGGFSLPELLRQEARSAVVQPKAKSCIMLFLQGGPSTIDMWDLKPEAPVEIRGPFLPIETNVPGTYVSEHCPMSARAADKFSIVRSYSHEDNGHITGYYYVMTGRRPRFRDGQNRRIPANVLFPSIGSRVARELGLGGAVPSYINVPAPMDAGGPGFYGPEFAPFVIESDPVQPDFEVRDLQLSGGVTSTRMSRRQKLLSGVERLQPADTGRAQEMSTYYQKAHDLITSPAARKAFNIHAEPESLRKRYGYSTIGQCALLSRRLVEAGCRFIGVDHAGWDTHFDCFPTLKDNLVPQADLAFSALVGDLAERGLLESTLVIMMGEMGRTPRVNGNAGRDHWGKAQSVLIAGGGIRGGQVIGATDKHASEPVRDDVLNPRPASYDLHADGDRHRQDILHAPGSACARPGRRPANPRTDMMRSSAPRWLCAVFALCVCWSAPVIALAQQRPEMGYVFPPGGRAGTTVHVRLGGYDFTPDTQFFVLDERVKLQVLGPPSEMLFLPPPYWFGPKASNKAFSVPREVSARFVLPKDMPVGVVHWQAANANGASVRGRVRYQPQYSGSSRGQAKRRSLPATSTAACDGLGLLEDERGDRQILLQD